MTRTEIIENIEIGTYFYNDNAEYAIEFWKEAVAKCPNEVKADIESLRDDLKNDIEHYRMDDFEFTKLYAEILKPLNIDIAVCEN